MNQVTLVEQLRNHLKQVESQAGYFYMVRLAKTIENLEKKLYKEDEDELELDLQSLGFLELAVQVRRRQFKYI